MVVMRGSKVWYRVPHLSVEGKGTVMRVLSDGKCYVKDDATIMVAVCRKENVVECDS